MNALHNTSKKSKISIFYVIRHLVLVAAVLFSVSAVNNYAATFTVTNSNDSGAGSLRQAIADANATASNDEIFFDGIGFATEQTIVLTSGELVVGNNGSLTINGTGANLLRIIITNAKRIFVVESGANVTINDVSIGGRDKSNGLGGGIQNSGTLTLNKVAVEGARAVEGGGVLNSAVLFVIDSTISNNTVNSEGGGIFNKTNASLSVVNSTIANNSANFEGGGISNRGTANVDYATISGNTVIKKSTSKGGGVFNAGTFTSRNSIYAYNMSKGTGPDFSGTLTSQGFNLLEDTQGANITGVPAGNQLNVDPLLDPVLRNNGGTTETLALLEDSPAIDAGDPLNVQAEDQRGQPRPKDGDGDFVARADIGAFELQPTNVPVQNGEIAFQSYRSGLSDIYTVNEDGTNLFRVTTSPYSELDPSFSPDGTKIAFESNRAGQTDIYIINPDGTNEQQITNDSFIDITPTFSPDGTRLAFSSDRDGEREIYVINVDGTGLQRVTNNIYFDGLPDYSPVEEKIVYFSSRNGRADIFTINSDGTNEQQLTSFSGNNLFPAFSPDGSKIVFISSRNGSGEVFIMNSDGTNQERLTFDLQNNATPSFSPDGTKIIFTSLRSGNSEVYTMNLDGSGLHQVTDNPASDGNPSWGPRRF